MCARRIITALLTMVVFTGASTSVDHDHHEDENLVRFSEEVMKRYDIKVAKAGSHTLEITREILGKITPNADKTLYIYPRYSGIIKKMTKRLGDEVRKGELLATVESNQTLQIYDVTAPFAGHIVKKEANPGEFIQTGDPIYQLADLSTVWVDLFVYRKNAERVKVGQPITIYNKNGTARSTKSIIDYVSPLGVEHNQTMRARAVLSNDTDALTWLPGLYVSTRVVIEKKQVSVAVDNAAIQRVNGQKVVFVKGAEGFEVRECRFGLQGERYTEVLHGVDSGEFYVVKNSFLLKAELERDSATHSH